MLRLFGFLVTLSVMIGAVALLDFNTVRNAAIAADEPAPDFQDYLSGLGTRLTSLLSPAPAEATGPALTTDLAQMLPRPPEGWTSRPAEGDDLKPFLPKERGKLDDQAEKLIGSLARDNAPKDSTAVAMTYEKGDRKVIIKAIRYADAIFANPKAIAALLQEGTPFRQRDYLRVRGLDILESTLPDGMRARLFTADVGGQIQLWVMVPRRTSDQDVLPFFETLDVRAMNAAVIDREDGLGEIPVMLLVSDLDEAGLAAYQADRAARMEARAKRQAEASAALAKTMPATGGESAPAAAEPSSVNCTEGAGGIKRCTVGG